VEPPVRRRSPTDSGGGGRFHDGVGRPAGRPPRSDIVTGIRVTAVVAILTLLAPRADAQLFGRSKGKTDAQIRTLVTTLRTEGDEKRRRAAVAELRDADPRTQADVIPALVASLQRDPSAHVRADAADALGSFRTVFPIAGSALEAAAESDPASLVRDMAQRSLWEYHLLGYRSSRGSDGFLGQSPEPPIAARPAPRPVAVLLAPVPTVVPARVDLPPPPVVPPTPPTVTRFRPSPEVVFPAPAESGPRIVFTTAPPVRLNLTEEPPIARRR
jgi:hypothetical protein